MLLRIGGTEACMLVCCRSDNADDDDDNITTSVVDADAAVGDVVGLRANTGGPERIAPYGPSATRGGPLNTVLLSFTVRGGPLNSAALLLSLIVLMPPLLSSLLVPCECRAAARGD